MFIFILFSGKINRGASKMYIILSIFTVYALGIISYEYNFYLYLFMIVFAALLYNTIKTKKFIYNIVIFLFLVISFLNCRYNSKSVLREYIDEEIQITAIIRNMNSPSDENQNYNSFYAEIVEINEKILNIRENTILYIYKNKHVIENSVIKFAGKAADINLSKNRMLFNYKNYMRSKKIYAVVFCSGEIDVTKNNYSMMNEISICFRKYAEYLFRSNLKSGNADILLSVILGDTDYLDKGFYENIKLMGLAHIFAVSGSHIVLLYGAIISLFKFTGLRRRISWIITWSMIWFYGFLIGFPISVLRSLVMFTLLFGSEVLYRRYNSLNSISLSALILTIVNPFWIFDAGFLLSFSAALSLIIYSKYIKKSIGTESKLINNVFMFLFLQLFMLPVTAYYFNYIPIMGILYNLVLIPFFTVILIFGFIMLIFGNVSGVIFLVPVKGFDMMISVLRGFIVSTENFALNGAIIRSFSIFESIFFYMFIFLSLYIYINKSERCGHIGFITLISFYIITYIIVPLTDSGLYFNVVDAGQGLFSTMSYKNLNYIFDCGSISSRNMGEYTAVPYLIKRGVNKVDAVFISHWDIDHYSGIYDIIKNDNINLANIFSYENGEKINFDIDNVKKGDCIRVDNNLKIEILWPYEGYIKDVINNSSLVILISFRGRKIMLPGDIELSVEDMIADELEHADILVVPHHGSITSSCEVFVGKTRPNIAVMSYGRNNFSIPSEKVIDRYEKAGSRIFSTFDDGEINFVLKNDKLYYNTYGGLKSDNYFELYFEGIMLKLFVSIAIAVWILITPTFSIKLQ